MCGFAFLPIVFRAFAVLTTTALAAWPSTSISWSPDGRWLSYTTSPGADNGGARPGWLFNATLDDDADNDTARPGGAPSVDGPTARTKPDANADLDRNPPYRIWATSRDARSSVALEESSGPLTAPSWSPVGRQIAYSRFVRGQADRDRSNDRGALEIVVQNGLGRKRAVLAVPDFEMDATARTMFPHVAPAWAPDGQWLAVTRVGRRPAVLIVRVDSGALVQTFEDAEGPAWSPDGSRLAFLQRSAAGARHVRLARQRGRSFAAGPERLAVSDLEAAPIWARDGRSIFNIVDRSPPDRLAGLGLIQWSPETNDSYTAVPLIAAAPGREEAQPRGLAIAFDRASERCYFSVAYRGRDMDIAASVPSERLIEKRFHPIDPRLRVAGLALAPDGRALALRFGAPDRLTWPAVYDLETDEPTLIVPDQAAKSAWLGALARTASQLLREALPALAAASDGSSVDRPTLLPLPSELPARGPATARLARLGQLGAAASNAPLHPEASDETSDAAGAGAAAHSEALSEHRLFFNYLRGDHVAASAALEDLEHRVDGPDRRLALLALKAQLLWSRGELESARAVSDYLVSALGGAAHRIEDTALGPVLTPEPRPGAHWARYLSSRVHSKDALAETGPDDDGPEEGLFPGGPLDPFAPNDPVEMERRRGQAPPFVPVVPRGQPRARPVPPHARRILRQR